jgi:hypothetical protein
MKWLRSYWVKSSRNATKAGVATAVIALLVLILTLPPAPTTFTVSYSVVDPYGGVFTARDGCELRENYAELDGFSVQHLTATTVEPVITVGVANAMRTNGDTCTWVIPVTVSAPSVGLVDQITGKAALPVALGQFQISGGNVVIGTLDVNRTAGPTVPATFSQSILVANRILGLYELGDKWTSCSGDSGTYPGKWNCSKSAGVSQGIFWWDIDFYRRVNVKANPKTGVCSGQRSFADFKRGATVTITGDNGISRGKLIDPNVLWLEPGFLERFFSVRHSYYLYSKTSKVIVCPLAWSIPDVPYSAGGYTIKVAGRPAVFRSAADLESDGWIIGVQGGAEIPGE